MLVALSATTRAAVPALRRAVAALRKAMQGRLQLAAGGQAFTAAAGLHRRLELDDVHVSDAAEAVVAIRLALGG